MQSIGRPTRPRGPLVGREALLDAVDDAREEVADGARRVVVITGPPGSGRTEALYAARERAAPAMVIDDLDAAEPAALEALERAWRDPRPALVLLTLRDGAAVPFEARGLLSDPAVTTWRLAPLAPEHVETLLAAARVPGGAALAEDCVRLAGGNARLVSAIVVHLASLEAVAAPHDLERAVLPLLEREAPYWSWQSDRCGEAAAALVEATVVLGSDAALWQVAELAGVERGTAAAAADALVQAGLLVSSDPVVTALPLAWAALDRRSSGARRDELHRRAARILARLPGALDAAAEHLLAAPPAGAAWAADVLVTSAREASEAGRSDAALARLERAAIEPVAPERQGMLLAELGAARDRMGAEGSEAALRRALTLSPPQEHPRVYLLLGRRRFGAGDYLGAAEAYELGLEGLDGEEGSLHGELIAGYVGAARFDRTLEGEAQRRLAPLLERRDLGRSPAERALLAEVALQHGIMGTPRTIVIDLALRAWADGRLLESLDEHGIAISQVAAALTWSDAFVESEQVLSRTVTHAERRGRPLLVATGRYLRAWPRYYRGALAGARADVEAALATEGWTMYEPSARAILAHLHLEQGDAVAARTALALPDPGAWLQTPPYAMLLEARGRLTADTDPGGALRDLREAGALLGAMGTRHSFCPWRSRAAVVAARLEDRAGAVELVDAELADARRTGLPHGTAVALHARALVSTAFGEDGIADLREALLVLGDCGADLERAGLLLDLGRLLRAAGDRTGSRTPLREALELATAMGATALVERTGRELRAAGGRPRSVGGLLTASELSVARMAADGRTNREIAEALIISPHTVRFHLGNAYRKLDVSDRAQLGAKLPRS